MMTPRRLFLFLGLVVSAASVAGAVWAQTSNPFDMSDDLAAPGSSPAVSQPLNAPVDTPPPNFAAPLRLDAPAGSPPPSAVPMTVPSIGKAPSTGASPPAQGGVSAMPSNIGQAPAAGLPEPAGPVQAVEPADSYRFIVPAEGLRLTGEYDERSWSIFMTTRQAARATRLSVSYKNALVVMPEGSRLRVLINDQIALETPLASSDDFATTTVDLPAGAWQPGPNVVRFQAIQRHRTDCTVQSTYELWTEINSAATRLAFPGASADELGPRTLEDLSAVGFDATGRTTIHFITPRPSDPATASLIVRLVQALVLYGRYPNPSVVLTTGKEATDGVGTLTVVLSPADEAASVLSSPPVDPGQPVVNFVEDPALGPAVLAITGSGWGQIAAAVDAIATGVDRPLGIPRTTLDTASWMMPEAHLFSGAETLTLGQLGVQTQQFSGRRFRTGFAIGIPADFYASDYGEATLLLDAAYTPDVLPASHIDVYVNGQIAATTRILTTDGGILRHYPVQIPFRHFHPGVNRIEIEAVLDAASDRTCGPGGSAAGPDRFVLFDTTAFEMPTFARIGRLPNLSALAGTGFPYNIAPTPSALVLGRPNAATMSAASTFLARLAMQAGRIVPFAVTPASSVGNRAAVFVGATPQIGPNVLAALNLSRDIGTRWKPDPLFDAEGSSDVNLSRAADEDQQDTDLLFETWRTKLSEGGGWRGQVSSIEDWLKRTFDISFASLSLGVRRSALQPFEPRAKASLLLAQSIGPGEQSPWTLLTAPTDEQLASATQALVQSALWSQLGGQYTTYSRSTGLIDTTAARDQIFVPTRPLSASNLRLIAANWLSNNITAYALCLIVMCIVLGLVTGAVLPRLGRPT